MAKYQDCSTQQCPKCGKSNYVLCADPRYNESTDMVDWKCTGCAYKWNVLPVDRMNETSVLVAGKRKKFFNFFFMFGRN